MDTKLLIATENHSLREESIRAAAKLLHAGEVVALPTETVYGLGADATNRLAVEKIFIAKGRPSDNPLIVHVANKEQLFELVEEAPAYVEKMIDCFSPGPITYVLKSSGKLASNVTAGLTTVGVRIPDNDVALDLISNSGLPIAAPSANISGKPSPTAAEHVLDDLNGKIAGILDGGPANVGVESTVVDCTNEIPVILRLGKITPDQIHNVAGFVECADGSKGEVGKPRSPGLKYKHYAPEVPLVLVKNRNELQRAIEQERKLGNRVGVLASAATAKNVMADEIVVLGESETEMAMKLYQALRSFKQTDVDLVMCESLPQEGVGKAVMDRIERAADKILE